jgi:hypothetical protein
MGDGAMSEIPSFYCSKTLLGYSGEDLNRIVLHGPDGFEFVLYEIGEARDARANQRCNDLAAKLREVWDAHER